MQTGFSSVKESNRIRLDWRRLRLDLAVLKIYFKHDVEAFLIMTFIHNPDVDNIDVAILVQS